MEKAWEVVHKPFSRTCGQGGSLWGRGCMDSQASLLPHNTGCVSTLLEELCLGDPSSLCMLYRCAVPQQEQYKRATLIHLHSISIDIFRALIGITFKMLLYDE